MDLQKLSEKYRVLQAENRKLKEKIKLLEKQIGKESRGANNEVEKIIIDRNQTIKPDVPKKATKTKTIDKQSSPTEGHCK